jgi:hypothetical protein
VEETKQAEVPPEREKSSRRRHRSKNSSDRKHRKSSSKRKHGTDQKIIPFNENDIEPTPNPEPSDAS